MIMSLLSNSPGRISKIVSNVFKKETAFRSKLQYSYFPKYSILLFFILVLAISVLYNYHEILFLRPQGIHQWRQCDCLSITMNYYQDNNPFLEPSLHFLGRDGTGKAASDFPLIYYFVAQLWKVFGHHEFIYRLVNLLIFFGGLLAMMKVFEDILQDTVLAFLGGLILFTSPTIVFYANNFLVNVPALGLSMIAWYMLWLFYKTGKPVTLWLALGIFAFAGLLKITSAISFVAFFILFLCETTGIIKLKQNKTLFIKHLNFFYRTTITGL